MGAAVFLFPFFWAPLSPKFKVNDRSEFWLSVLCTILLISKWIGSLLTFHYLSSCQLDPNWFAGFDKGCCRWVFLSIYGTNTIQLQRVMAYLWHKWFFLSNSEGQPESIVEDIEDMVRTYVEKVITDLFIVYYVFHCHMYLLYLSFLVGIIGNWIPFAAVRIPCGVTLYLISLHVRIWILYVAIEFILLNCLSYKITLSCKDVCTWSEVPWLLLCCCLGIYPKTSLQLIWSS